MKTYTNDSYTRTVEVIKTSNKCLDWGFSQNVKVTTVWNDIFGINNGLTSTTEERYYTTEDFLSYERCGYKYYTKRR
jgi:hypothetical protein